MFLTAATHQSIAIGRENESSKILPPLRANTPGKISPSNNQGVCKLSAFVVARICAILIFSHALYARPTVANTFFTTGQVLLHQDLDLEVD